MVVRFYMLTTFPFINFHIRYSVKQWFHVLFLTAEAVRLSIGTSYDK